MGFSNVIRSLVFILLISPVIGMCADGNKLLAQIQSKDPSDNLQAFNYVSALLDYEELMSTKEALEIAYPLPGEKKQKFSMQMFCIPQGATGKQVLDIVQMYLENNPGNRHQTAILAVRKSLIETWPCKGNQAPTGPEKK
jgi:hypothetical protein